MSQPMNRWQQLRTLVAPRRELRAERWIVVDTETSGLDPASDALLAIGGVAVDADGIRPGDSFETLLHNTSACAQENILVHGIGRGAQRDAVAAHEALSAFSAWAQQAPCIGFHAPFDRAVLRRAARLAGVALGDEPWLDLAPLASVLAGDEAANRNHSSLDDWLLAYGIGCSGRHNAASDAMASAGLLLRLRALAARQVRPTFAGLMKLAGQGRWLGTGR